MSTALIGWTGFVGCTLLRQHNFDALYRSTNIGDIAGQSYDTIICAGASAKKWLANKEPGADLESIEKLMSALCEVKCKNFVLISTVDVFKNPVGVDESSPVDETDLHPYGLHRRTLERFVEAKFAEHLIVRLPGLVGPCLRKNAVYDLLHGNNIEALDSRAVFQFYPMVNLKHDIDTAWQERLNLVHLTSAPISVGEIADLGFNRKLPGGEFFPPVPVKYDFKSHHAGKFGGGYGYQYTKKEVLLAIRAYAQSEVLANAAVHI